jgi:hypothetical protein
VVPSDVLGWVLQVPGALSGAAGTGE